MDLNCNYIYDVLSLMMTRGTYTHTHIHNTYDITHIHRDIREIYYRYLLYILYIYILYMRYLLKAKLLSISARIVGKEETLHLTL